MEGIRIFPDAEQGGMFAEVAGRDELIECSDLRVGGLANGTESGKPVAVVAAKTPAGNIVVVQTTLALFLSAADALKARHGDPRTSGNGGS